MHKSTLLFSCLWFLTATATPALSQDREILARAHRAQLEFREGNLDVARPLVKTLEDAVAKSPDNAALWEALGHACMSLLGSLYAGPPDIQTLITVAERARGAYARSLELDPKSALVKASQGMSRMVLSQLKGDGPGIAAGVEEMNAAVRQSPKSILVRLTRAFTIIHLPPAMRDTHAVTEDLQFILDTAAVGRAEDVIHVLLGDVHAEMGNVGAARAEYQLVTGASAFAAEQAKLRLQQPGPIAPASIALVRAGTGTRCAMCHAPGIDL
jgi:hypothetical protein